MGVWPVLRTRLSSTWSHPSLCHEPWKWWETKEEFRHRSTGKCARREHEKSGAGDDNQGRVGQGVRTGPEGDCCCVIPRNLSGWLVGQERGYRTDGIRSKCSPVCGAETSQDCCLARMLSRQDDVRSQISMLEAAITCRGHLCIFLPKFHCELNPIEMVCCPAWWISDKSLTGYQYWGQTKRKYRDSRESKLTFAHQRALVEKCLDDYSLETLRKYINRVCAMFVFFYETSADMCHSQAWRFMSAYRKGLSYKAAEWAVRRQKSHRKVSARAYQHLGENSH